MRNGSVCLCLLLLVLAVYWPVRHFEFVNYDDEGYIYENPHTTRGISWDEIAYAFGCTDQANYHPLIWISLSLDVSLFGLHPGAFHLENVLLHAANTVMLYGFLVRATGYVRPALLSALLFAVHPVHVESVAWVTERKDALSGFFFLLGLLTYLEYARTTARIRKSLLYLLTLCMLILGLLSKQMLVTFPFVLLLLDYWPLCRNATWKKLIVEKLPMLPLCAAACVATYFAQHAGGAVVNLQSLPLHERVFNAVLAYVRYLGKIVWPTRLSVFYPRIYAFSLLSVMLCLAFLLIVTAGCFVLRRRMPYLLVGWLFYLGTLVPVLGFVQVGWQSIADRYLYLPIIGPILMIAYGTNQLATKAAGKWARRVLDVGAALVLLIMAILTSIQLRVWSDTRTLFNHAIAVTGPNAIAHVQLGYLDSRLHNIAAARFHYEEAVRIEPTYFVAQFDLANLLLQDNKPQLAIEHYRAAAQSQPQLSKIQNNWGIASLKVNDPSAACQHFQRAIELDPSAVDPHFNLGQLLLEIHQFNNAESEFREVLRLQPDHVGANRGINAIRTARGRATSS